MRGTATQDPTVTTARCASYASEEVRQAVVPLLETLLQPSLRPGCAVLVKPNLLRGWPAERAVVTHPTLLLEVCRWLKEWGCAVTVGESPGLGSTHKNLRGIGALEPLQKLGVEILELADPQATLVPGGMVVPLSRTALEAEVLLNLPKWKTHVQSGLTAGVKNLFGCVVGPRKALLHFRHGHREEAFAAMFPGIAAVLRPELTLVDGVVAMEGNGPSEGTPKTVGYLIAGKEPFAVDAVLAHATGFARLPLLDAARELALGETRLDRIPVAGAGLPGPDALQFHLPTRSSFSFNPVRRLWIRHRGALGQFESI